MNSLLVFLARASRLVQMLEDGLLVLILAGMILLAAAQIALRNFFGIGFIWADELLRLLVLWLALAGAVAAGRADKQINVAVIDRFLPGWLQLPVKLLIHLFTATVCVIVTIVSVRFVQSSREYGDVLLGNVPAWWLQIILPIGFAALSWHYAYFSLMDVLQMLRPQPAKDFR